MNSFKLFFSVVPHGKGEKLTRAAMESGCRGGTVLMGRGLAKTNLAAILGLGENSKDVIMMVVEKSACESVKNAIQTATSKEKRHFGELFSVGVDSLLKGGNIIENLNAADENMEEDIMSTQNEMITVIVNKGYAEDAMAAARKAGAGGGTIIGARGTAREDDAAFFGMKIVPEKEMLMILVPTDKKDYILQAITSLPCFSEAGSGIVFCNEAKNFTLLGKK